MADNINLAKPLKITTPGIAPIADLVVADVAALEAIGSPWLGMTVYVEADGKSRKITALKNVAVGPLSKKAVGTYELIPDQSALDGKADADHNHSGTYAPLADGKIPPQYFDVPAGITQFSLIRPKYDNALHLYLEAAEDADYTTAVLTIDTLNVAADRAKVLLSEDAGTVQRWISMPEDGAGSAYDDAPAVVDLTELTGPRYYLRYRWYNADTSGDWHCALFPACGGGSGGGSGEAATIENVSVSIDDSVTAAEILNTGTKTAANLEFKFPKKIFTDSANNAYKTVSSLLYQAGLVTNPNDFPPELTADLPEIPEGVSPDSSLYPELELGDEPVIADGNRVWYIYPNGQGTKDGSSWDNAMANVRDAAAAAISGDVIYVMEGRYPLIADIKLKDGVSIYGGFVDTDRTWAGRSPFVHRSVFDANHLAAGITLESFGTGTICDGLTLLNSTGGTAISCGIVRHCIVMGANVTSAVVYAKLDTFGAIRCLIKDCKSNNNSSTSYSCIVRGDATNCLIVNCTSINTSTSVVTPYSAYSCIVRDDATNCLIVNCTSTVNGGIDYYIVGGDVTNCSIVRSKGRLDDGNKILKNNLYFLVDGYIKPGTTCASTKNGYAVKLSEDNVQTRFISLGTVTEIGAIEIDDPENYDWSAFGNFRPVDSYSALVGAGTEDASVTTDADGNPRPNPPSIGAYEVPPQA